MLDQETFTTLVHIDVPTTHLTEAYFYDVGIWVFAVLLILFMKQTLIRS